MKKKSAAAAPCRRRRDRGAVLEFSMTPLDKGESVSAYVARSLDLVDRSGLPYQLHPMGTVVEGDWNEVLALVTSCFDRMREDCDRISVSIKVDWRRGGSGRLASKIASVEHQLGRRLETGTGVAGLDTKRAASE